MSDEEKRFTPEELLKDTPKYPDRAVEEEPEEVLMADVYGGPDMPEMAGVYMGPPEAQPSANLVYMGPGGAQMPAAFMAYAGPSVQTIPNMGIMMNAAQSQYVPDPDSKFCEECGAKNPKDVKFCTECGQRFKE
ncbi:MAG: zinc ribbon domain-containing protein [Clostridiales bacterium]|nr:zinc ribbon domain-containing protein [Clostridiales bacterium]